jgi:hypothetical protein
MDSETFSIDIGLYQKLASIDTIFTDTHKFDEECGISFMGLDPSKLDTFFFKVTDRDKLFLAKIKYGI